MGLIHETDYGTPASKAEKQISLTIDGKAISVPEGTSGALHLRPPEGLES